MLIKKYGFFLLFISWFLLHCKEEPVPIPDLKVGSRKVLLEELSGVNCSNCPDAAKEIEKIRAATGPENIVSVTIYPSNYGVLSRPLSDSRYDFRFPEADALVNHLGAALAIPALSVNRVVQTVSDNTPFLITRTQWGGVVRNELTKQADIGIFINISYDKNKREASVRTDLIPEKTLQGDHFITLCITQDSVIDAQNDRNVILKNYPHRHVLRRFITPPSGEKIQETLQANALIVKNYNLKLPVEWDETKCSVVAFVHRGGDPNQEVLQAEEKKIVP